MRVCGLQSVPSPADLDRGQLCCDVRALFVKLEVSVCVFVCVFLCVCVRGLWGRMISTLLLLSVCVVGIFKALDETMSVKA